MMVVAQTGKLIVYDTLVQAPIGGCYTISEMKFTQFQNFPPGIFWYFLFAAKHTLNYAKMVVQTGKVQN